MEMITQYVHIVEHLVIMMFFISVIVGWVTIGKKEVHTHHHYYDDNDEDDEEIVEPEPVNTWEKEVHLN